MQFETICFEKLTKRNFTRGTETLMACGGLKKNLLSHQRSNSQFLNQIFKALHGTSKRLELTVENRKVISKIVTGC